MTYRRLELINHTLSLIGENQLTTSDNQLGVLVANVVNTAIATVAQETRHNCFEIIEQPTVTETDYLLPAYAIPDSVIQILGVNCRVSVDGFGDVLDVLPYIELSDLDFELGYSVVNGSIYISKNIARPLTLFIHTIQTKELPVNDNGLVNVPNQVAYATAHVAASILCLSYLDNPNAASVQRNLAQTLIDKLTKQQGIGRSKTFNLKPKNNRLRGLSTQYQATLYLTKSTADATYLSITDAASTYQTIADMSDYYTSAQVNSTFLTQANAASTYLTQANAASTYQTIAGMSSYALLASPAFTGTPTAPTAVTGTATTQVATTAFVDQEITAYYDVSWTAGTLLNSWINFGSGYQDIEYRKIGDIVYVRGLVTKTADFLLNTIITLPVGYRPPNTVFCISSVGTNTTLGSGNIAIATNGDLSLASINYGMTGTTYTYVEVDVYFSTKA